MAKNVGSNCWACDTLYTKRVAQANPPDRKFTWSCPECGVSWRKAGRPLHEGEGVIPNPPLQTAVVTDRSESHLWVIIPAWSPTNPVRVPLTDVPVEIALGAQPGDLLSVKVNLMAEKQDALDPSGWQMLQRNV